MLALMACRGEPNVVPACLEDSDCALGLRCLSDAQGAFCGCLQDASCAPDEWCNSASRCQRRLGCQDNQDCGEGLFCDLSSGLCLPVAQCGGDVHCPPSSVCLGQARGCVPGCREDGDCRQFQICDDSQADLHPDGLGSCAEGCRSHAACSLGARCVGGRCYDSPNQSHCAPCSEGLDCPDQSDWCLINPAHDRARPETGGAFQCAVDCEGRPEICPNGYLCTDVVRLTDDPCERIEDCPGTRRCVLGEGQSRGFCGCSRDQDCSYERVPATCTLAGCLYPPGRPCGQASACESVQRCADHEGTGTKVCYRNRQTICETFEDCLCVGGSCVRSGRVCEQGSDCNPTCVENRCKIGQACSPEEGLYCSDLR